MDFEQFEISEVGRRVWAAVARPGAGATSNAGIVDLGHATLVFDTSLTPQGAKELRLAARLLTGRDPSYVVNSHWHFDHTLGNHVFGGCTIVATEKTRNLLEVNGQRTSAMIADPTWNLRTMDLQTKAVSESRPAFLEEIQTEIAARRDLAAASDAAEIRVPDQTFRDRYRFEGDRGVVVIEGGGHSESDSVVWVHDAEVLFAGDLVAVSCYPNMETADINRWTKALNGIEGAKPRVIVPGHGPVGPLSTVALMRKYFQWLLLSSSSDHGSPAPREIISWKSPSNGQRNLEIVRELR